MTITFEPQAKNIIEDIVSVNDTIICNNQLAIVTDIINYAPGTHGFSPIKNDLVAIEYRTDKGSRWIGLSGYRKANIKRVK